MQREANLFLTVIFDAAQLLYASGKGVHATVSTDRKKGPSRHPPPPAAKGEGRGPASCIVGLKFQNRFESTVRNTRISLAQRYQTFIGIPSGVLTCCVPSRVAFLKYPYARGGQVSYCTFRKHTNLKDGRQDVCVSRIPNTERTRLRCFALLTLLCVTLPFASCFAYINVEGQPQILTVQGVAAMRRRGCRNFLLRQDRGTVCGNSRRPRSGYEGITFPCTCLS